MDTPCLCDPSEDPAIPVSVGGQSIWCTKVYGTWLAEDYIHLGAAIVSSSPVSRTAALVLVTRSDLDLLGPIISNDLVATFGFLAVVDVFASIGNLGRSRDGVLGPHVSELYVFHGVVTSHHVHEFGHGPRLMAEEVLGKPIVLDSEMRQILVYCLAWHMLDEGQIPSVCGAGTPGAVFVMRTVSFGMLGSE